MAMEAKAQAKLGVSAEKLWKAMAKDYKAVIPKVMPNSVENIEIIEGDGGIGSVLFFQLCSRGKSKKTQKERIVELDEEKYRFGLEVVEGIVLRKGYSSLKTSFELTPEGEEQTMVDVKVEFELVADENGDDDRRLQLKENASKPALGFVLALEKYILENS